MFNLRRQANPHDPDSLSNRMRARRFALFQALAERLPKPLRVLDIGGTSHYWESHGWAEKDDVEITVLNQVAEEPRYANIIPVAGDAARLDEFEDGEFSIAYSNSVIEHLFTLENQHAMAREVMRVGRAYWVQTPNFWFPIEPHFHVPGWQWMPVGMRVWTLRRRTCGWRGPCPDAKEARTAVEEVRLISRREYKRMFPEAKMVAERFLGLSKSLIAVGGFPGDVPRSV